MGTTRGGGGYWLIEGVIGEVVPNLAMSITSQLLTRMNIHELSGRVHTLSLTLCVLSLNCLLS